MKVDKLLYYGKVYHRKGQYGYHDKKSSHRACPRAATSVPRSHALDEQQIQNADTHDLVITI
jgi:hypothetical protein